MAENKFIERLQGKGTEKSVVEIKNTATPTMFTNMPAGDSNDFNTYSDHRGNATVVANGTMNWKVDSLQTLTPANIVNGNGEDFTTSMATSGAGLWINAEYTFPSTGDPNHPVAMVFNPQTKWVLKVCGDNLLSPTSNTIDFTVLITFGSNNIISKTFTVAEQANKFSKEFVIDFAESNTNVIKAQGLSSMKLQLLCGTADASANIYGGMTVLTCLQRKVEAVAISSTFANVEEVLRDGIIPSDYFNNQAYIAQVTDGDTAYAVFQRDGDEMLFVGWNQPIPDQTGNSGKFLMTNGSLMSWEQLTISDVDGLQDDLDGLQDQIDDLSGRGRYLSIWNCTTGLAETNPPTSPYIYQSGDYFIVGTVGATNYKPDGSSYTTGVASTTVETAEVKVNDVYLYDGTNWKLLASSQRTYTFAGIAGSPYDNTNLGNALNTKVDANAAISGATKCKITYDNKGLVTAGADLAESDIPLLHLSKISDVTASASEVNVLDGITASTSELNILDGITATTAELNYTDGVTSNIQTQLDGKQATISDLATIRSNASAGKAASDTIATYGNIVTHNVSEFATAAQGAKADTALQAGDNVSDLANDAGYLVMGDLTNFVTKNTAQTISGLKTFSADIVLSGTTSIKNTTSGVSYTMLYRDTSGIHVGTSTQALLLAGSGTRPTFNGNNVAMSADIPTVNNPTITITQGGVTKGSFTLNQSSGDTIALDSGGGSIDAIDNLTITKNSDDEIQAVATVNANTATGATNPVYDWVGTLAEYQAQNIETLHPDWMCYITDDVSAGVNVYTKTEVDTIASGKANVALDNLTSAGKEVCANMAMPSDRVVALTLGASGATYTAPADGYVCFTGMATAAGQYIYIGSPTFNNVGFQSSSTGNGEYIIFTIPVSKGQVFTINYNLGSNRSLRFIYAQGAQ